MATSADYSQLPASCSIGLSPFRVHIDEEKIKLMQDLVALTPIAVSTYENSFFGPAYGVQKAWLEKAKAYWTTEFDWREREKRINSFPHFTAPLREDSSGEELSVHFVALFSKKSDAIPLAVYHGWPGSFLEHLNMLDLLRQKYTPETLPYHVIVPSLTGFAFSSGPPLRKDFVRDDQVRLLDKLMTGLFGSAGYLAHGGDMGSGVAIGQAVSCESCKGAHFNNLVMYPPENADRLEVNDLERKSLARREDVMKTGIAYAIQQATKPATVGLALGSNPLGLLAWIGEKFDAWADGDIALDLIIESVALYFLTDTFPRSLWNYRGFINDGPFKWPAISKPTGYSFFPQDVLPVPVSWVKDAFSNVVMIRRHETGGHFPGFEKPRELLQDIEDWIALAWKLQ